jgi:ribonucleotide monophosphatase NagD (HAD superfamily)
LNIEYIQYGKPNEPTYDYCEKLLYEQALAQNVEISKFYMIGDNPDSDIDGANRRGSKWVSILVRTGVFQGGENSDKHPA